MEQAPFITPEKYCTNIIETYTTANDFRLYCDPIIFYQSKLIALIPAKTGSTIFRHSIIPMLKKYIPSQYTYAINTNKPDACLCADQLKRSPHNDTILQICQQQTIKYFCNSQYDKYMIIRDPLARLLSGYLDKCTLSTHNRWSFWHEPCSDYLLSVGINTHKLAKRRQNSKHKKMKNSNNSFAMFLKWLTNSYENGDWIDNHFKNLRYFADIEYFIQHWNVFDINDMNGLDSIVHKLLHENKSFYGIWENMKNELHLLSYENKEIHSKINGVDQHKTNANKRVLMYYNNSNVLKMAIEYLWKDYEIFNKQLPQWICSIEMDDNLIGFLQSLPFKMRHRFDILPNCINNTIRFFDNQ